MAVEQVIKISLDDLKALGGIDNLKKSLGETEASTKSLKQQLREATAEVAQMAEKYGETSKETIQAAKQAAELKDKIEDANDAIMAFKGEGAFLATGKALQSVASGFAAAQGAMGLFGSESENVEKAILKVQSAMALAQGLEGLEDAGRAFTQLKTVAVDAFNSIKAAIGSTGIGALVIALGAIYYYWDDIKEAVSGVSAEQQKLNEKTAENLAISQKNLESLNSQDNVLKLQGKSEKEIIALKLKKYDITIKDAKANLTAIAETNKQAYEGTVRNANLTKLILTQLANGALITTRLISAPIDLLIKGANYVSKALGGKGFDFSLNEQINKGIDTGVSWLTKQLFDPSEIKTEGEKSIQAAKDVLTKLENDRAGLILSQRNSGGATSTKSNTSTSTKTKDKSATEKKDPLDAINPATGNTYKSELESMKAAQAAQTQAKLDQLNLEDQINSQAYEREKEWSEKKKAIAEIEKDHKIQMMYQIANALQIAAEAAGESTAVGKALAVASTVISTYQTAQQAYASAFLPVPTIYSPILGRISQGIAIATGLMNVKKILAVKTPSKGGGSASMPSAGDSVGSVPRPQFNVAGDAGVNQIASTLANQPPVKAYVVGKEVSTQQSLDRNIVKNATLG